MSDTEPPEHLTTEAELRPNPFYQWLKSLVSNTWFKAAIGFFAVAAFTPPPVVKWAQGILIDRVDSIDTQFTYAGYCIAFNFIITLVASLILVSYRRHVDGDALALNINAAGRDKRFAVLSMDDGRLTGDVKSAAVTTSQVSSRMLYLYTSISILYLILALERLVFKNIPDVNRAVDVVEVLVNNISVALLASIYYRLTFSHLLAGEFIQKRMTIIGFGLMTLSAVHAVSLATPWFDTTNLWAHVISGLCVGATFALVVGKLDTLMVGTPTLILWLMYLYAVLQGLFVFFMATTPGGLNEERLGVVLYASLLLKIIMFLFFMWTLRKDRLLLHLTFSRVLDRKILGDMDRLERIVDETDKARLEKYYAHRNS